jgi:hypothetical protein
MEKEIAPEATWPGFGSGGHPARSIHTPGGLKVRFNATRGGWMSWLFHPIWREMVLRCPQSKAA